MKMRELLRTKKQWTQDVYARTAKGNSCSEHSRYAVCWCLDGAVNKCYDGGDEYVEIMRKMADYLGIKIYELANYNDSPDTKWSEVKKMLHELDI